MSRTKTRSGSSTGTARRQTRGRSKRSQDAANTPLQEGLRITGSILGIIIGLVIAVAGFGFWYLSSEGVDILREIASRDVSGPRQQVDQYEEFFSGLDTQQFIVRRDEPRNLQNVITYLWTVEHRQSGEVIQFRWEWDMATLDVLPRSNGALLLDRRLKNISAEAAEDYDFYDPEDAFAMAIVTQDVSLIGMEDLDGGWGGPEYKEGVAPPLISPDDAKGRASRYEEEQRRQLEDGLDGGTEEGEEENQPIVNLDPDSPGDNSG